jgi:kumamolisin
MIRSRRYSFRRVGSVALLCSVLLTGVGMASGTAALGDPTVSPPGDSPVPQGINPTQSPQAQATGATNPHKVVYVSFIFKERGFAQLESKIEAGWSGPYLSVAQFASQYAPAPSIVQQLVSYLSSFGIQPQTDANGLDVTSTGTIGQYEKALNITENDYTLQTTSGPQEFYASKENPSLPSAVANALLVVLGVTDFAPFDSTAVRALDQPSTTSSANNGIPKSELLPSDFAARYNLNPLTKYGDEGQGTTMGIVTLASFDPTVPPQFWSQYLGLGTPPNRITTIEIDGGAGPVSLKAGSDESTIDVEQSGAIAPDAMIDAYVAPNTDYGYQDAYEQAASDNIADTISSSWGFSETIQQVAAATGNEPPALPAAFDEVFAELAAQGQSNFTASGDSGAYSPSADIGTTNLGTQSPASSPLVTAVGGTTLPGTQTYPVVNTAGKITGTESVTIPTEMTWGWDYLWPMYTALPNPPSSEAAAAPKIIGGSGGGYSVYEPSPSYQDGISGIGSFNDYQFLTPIDPVDQGAGIFLPTQWSFSPNPQLGVGTGVGRAVPDVSFNGDPQTGYAVFDPQYTKPFGSPIQEVGGTSFVGPQLDGVTAIYDSMLSRRIGFWNPVIYAAAASSRSPFTPLSSDTVYGSSYYSATGTGSIAPGAEFANDNLFYTGAPGAIYNVGSGLGPANLTALERFFAAS